MQHHTKTNRQITASSYRDTAYPYSARLNAANAGWEANKSDSNPWLQVDLLSYHTLVTKVATQGSGRTEKWVSSYYLQYSMDGVAFHYYKEVGKNENKVR